MCSIISRLTLLRSGSTLSISTGGIFPQRSRCSSGSATFTRIWWPRAPASPGFKSFGREPGNEVSHLAAFWTRTFRRCLTLPEPAPPGPLKPRAVARLKARSEKTYFRVNSRPDGQKEISSSFGECRGDGRDPPAAHLPRAGLDGGPAGPARRGASRGAPGRRGRARAG